jgi:hypothetical protein
MNHYEIDIKMLEKGVSDLKTTNTRHDEQITTLNNTLKKLMKIPLGSNEQL